MNNQGCTPSSGSSVTATFEYLTESDWHSRFKIFCAPHCTRPPRRQCPWCAGTGTAVIVEGHDGFSRPCQECLSDVETGADVGGAGAAP